MDGLPDCLHEREGELCCEGVRLSEIGTAVGTPCYVYSETAVRGRYAALAEAFVGAPCRVFYSVKANHNRALLRVFRELGAGADVVSLGELIRARRAGFAGADIVFGGVGKRVDELEAALAEDVFMVNVESESELRALSELAVARGATARVAVRVNPGIEAGGHAYTRTGHYKTKFGVAWEDAEALYELAARLDGIEPIGVDAHIGSQIFSTEPYRQVLQRLGELAGAIRARGIELRYLDIGGGFGVPHEGGAGIDLRAVGDAARAVTAEYKLTVLVEPGRWLVAPAGILLARVLYAKNLGDQRYYVTDTGSNDLVRPSYYSAHHPVEMVQRAPATEVADVVGPVCEAGDFLALGCEVPALREGDLLAVLYAGAYGFVMSSNYNSRPRAAEVLVSGDRYRVVRRRETIEELMAAEELDD
ncbi:MAG: diaminopimelate decarboxylase [Gemmatimonadota bacterium]|nr:MAG: diaminopimelate decarboxylase [Gemmatimonadota bacterium]